MRHRYLLLLPIIVIGFATYPKNAVSRKPITLLRTGGEGNQVVSPNQELKQSVEPDTEANRTLWEAVKDSDVAGIKRAFASGADPNSRVVWQKLDGTKSEGTMPFPIMSAIHEKDFKESERVSAIAIFRMFVEQGADMHLTDSDGKNSVYWAANLNDVDLLRLVLDKGADVQVVPKARPYGGGNIVNLITMMTLRDKEQLTIPLLELVLERGANPNLYSSTGMTPLHQAALIGLPKSVALLLKHGADPSLSTKSNPYNPMGRGTLAGTALILAQRGGNEEVIRLLSATRKNMTLVEAATIGDIPSLKKYLNAGADANEEDAQGTPLLQLAAASGKVDAVRLLLQHHADVQTRGRYNTTALHRAAVLGHTAVALLLLQAGANPNAVQGKSRQITQIPGGIPPGAFPEPPAETPLSLAVRAAEADMVALLLKHGADLNVSTNQKVLTMAIQNAGRRPLRVIGKSPTKRPDMNTLLQQQDRIYELLVARTNIHKNGGSALCQAVESQQFGIARDLIMRGANINAINQGNSVLMLTINTIGVTRDTGDLFAKQGNREAVKADQTASDEGIAFLRFLLSRKPNLRYVNRQAGELSPPPPGKKELDDPNEPAPPMPPPPPPGKQTSSQPEEIPQDTALNMARFWGLKDVVNLLKKAGAKR